MEEPMVLNPEEPQLPGPDYMRWTQTKPTFTRTPLGLSGLFVQLLKEHFTRRKVYSSNPLESKLIIELHQQWNPANCENYPGIYVQRGEWQVAEQYKVIGNIESLLVSSDRIQQTLPIYAMYNMLCIGKEYGEVEKLLDEVWKFFVGFGTPIRNAYELGALDVKRISGVQLVREEKGFRMGAVEIGVLFDYRWELVTEKGLIKEIII